MAKTAKKSITAHPSDKDVGLKQSKLHDTSKGTSGKIVFLFDHFSKSEKTINQDPLAFFQQERSKHNIAKSLFETIKDLKLNQLETWLEKCNDTNTEDQFLVVMREIFREFANLQFKVPRKNKVLDFLALKMIEKGKYPLLMKIRKYNFFPASLEKYRKYALKNRAMKINEDQRFTMIGGIIEGNYGKSSISEFVIGNGFDLENHQLKKIILDCIFKYGGASELSQLYQGLNSEIQVWLNENFQLKAKGDNQKPIEDSHRLYQLDNWFFNYTQLGIPDGTEISVIGNALGISEILFLQIIKLLCTKYLRAGDAYTMINKLPKNLGEWLGSYMGKLPKKFKEIQKDTFFKLFAKGINRYRQFDQRNKELANDPLMAPKIINQVRLTLDLWKICESKQIQIMNLIAQNMIRSGNIGYVIINLDKFISLNEESIQLMAECAKESNGIIDDESIIRLLEKLTDKDNNTIQVKKSTKLYDIIVNFIDLLQDKLAVSHLIKYNRFGLGTGTLKRLQEHVFEYYKDFSYSQKWLNQHSEIIQIIRYQNPSIRNDELFNPKLIVHAIVEMLFDNRENGQKFLQSKDKEIADQIVRVYKSKFNYLYQNKYCPTCRRKMNPVLNKNYKRFLSCSGWHFMENKCKCRETENIPEDLVTDLMQGMQLETIKMKYGLNGPTLINVDDYGNKVDKSNKNQISPGQGHGKEKQGNRTIIPYKNLPKFADEKFLEGRFQNITIRLHLTRLGYIVKCDCGGIFEPKNGEEGYFMQCSNHPTCNEKKGVPQEVIDAILSKIKANEEAKQAKIRELETLISKIPNDKDIDLTHSYVIKKARYEINRATNSEINLNQRDIPNIQRLSLAEGRINHIEADAKRIFIPNNPTNDQIVKKEVEKFRQTNSNYFVCEKCGDNLELYRGGNNGYQLCCRNKNKYRNCQGVKKLPVIVIRNANKIISKLEDVKPQTNRSLNGKVDKGPTSLGDLLPQTIENIAKNLPN